MKYRLLVIMMLVSVRGTAAPELPPPPDMPPPDLAIPASEPQDAETTQFTPLSLPGDTLPAMAGEDEESSPNTITIALDDIALIDVVRMFSRISNANIIATPSNLTERVTANLDGVEWRPALSSILAMHNLALIEKTQGSGVYSVVSQPADAPPPMVVETLFLDYTTVDEVLPVIERMLPPGGSISTFASRNAIVIRSTEANLGEISYVIKNIDILSKQVCIETQFMELNDSAITQLGIRWDSLENMGINFQAGPFVRQSESQLERSRSDQLNRSDQQSSIDLLDQRYDMFGDQFEAASETDKFDEPTRNITTTLDLSQEASSDVADTFARTLTESSAAILNVDSLNVVLSALKRTDGVSIVSNPKMIVANGTTNAFFSVGQREPIIKRTIKRGTADSPGDEITANLDTDINTEYIRNGYLHTGIELRVIPTVKLNDLIEAQIDPSLRRKVGEKTLEGNSWPEISVKEIKTKFTLQSGQSVAIGGLTDTTDSKRTSKVPLLGDLPIIGKYLFSHTRDETTQIETIIFVTLTLVEPRDLMEDQGIPERAELVHKARIQAGMRKREFEEELDRLQQTADALDTGTDE